MALREPHPQVRTPESLRRSLEHLTNPANRYASMRIVTVTWADPRLFQEARRITSEVFHDFGETRQQPCDCSVLIVATTSLMFAWNAQPMDLLHALILNPAPATRERVACRPEHSITPLLNVELTMCQITLGQGTRGDKQADPQLG
jgi:hypothetical protein